MQGVTWHGTVEDHGGGAHRKHESETEEADARPPEPLGTQPQPHQPPYWRDDGWEWNGAGWRRTGQVSPQADDDDDDQHFKEVRAALDEDEDEDEEEGEEKRPYDPALAGPN